jgi:hypothetical protein
MRIHQITFHPPPGFTDRTLYAFEDPGTLTTINVITEDQSEEVHVAEDVIRERRQRVEYTMQGEAVVEKEVATSLAGLPARELDFTYRRKGTNIRERWVAAIVPEHRYVLLSYSSPIDPRYQLEFDHILNSVSLASSPTGANSDGYSKQNADSIWLYVPNNFSRPSSFTYVSSQSKARIDIALYDLKDAMKRMLTPDEEVQAESRAGKEVSNVKTDPLMLGSVHGTSTSYDVSDAESPAGDRRKVRRIRLYLEDGLAVTVDGRAPAENVPELEQALRVLLPSFGLAR